jgi:hypothetical protein
LLKQFSKHKKIRNNRNQTYWIFSWMKEWFLIHLSAVGHNSKTNNNYQD